MGETLTSIMYLSSVQFSGIKTIPMEKKNTIIFIMAKNKTKLEPI